MTMMQPIAEAAEKRWHAAEREADAFRGAFIRHHARGEALISEALLALHGCKRSGAAVELPHLAGQRLASLRDAVERRTAEDAHFPAVLPALDGFKQFERVRGFLCHGLAAVTLDRQGGWCFGIKVLALRAHRPEWDSLFLPKIDAEASLDAIAGAVSRLSSSLGHVRKYAAG